MGWRRESWLFLAWLAASVAAIILVATRGATGLGLAECEPDGLSVGACAALTTVGWLAFIVVVGGIGTLVTTALWIRSRPVRPRCSGCHATVQPQDATCPRCGRDLRGVHGPPPGWGSSGHD